MLSSLVILLIQFCLKLKSSEGKTFQESIDFLFANEFNLTPDVKNVMEQIQEKEEEEEDFDFVPESETLNEAKNAKLDRSSRKSRKNFTSNKHKCNKFRKR